MPVHVGARPRIVGASSVAYEPGRVRPRPRTIRARPRLEERHLAVRCLEVIRLEVAPCLEALYLEVDTPARSCRSTRTPTRSCRSTLARPCRSMVILRCDHAGALLLRHDHAGVLVLRRNHARSTTPAGPQQSTSTPTRSCRSTPARPCRSTSAPTRRTTAPTRPCWSSNTPARSCRSASGVPVLRHDRVGAYFWRYVSAEIYPGIVSAEKMPRHTMYPTCFWRCTISPRHIAGGISPRRCTAASSPRRRCRRTSLRRRCRDIFPAAFFLRHVGACPRRRCRRTSPRGRCRGMSPTVCLRCCGTYLRRHVSDRGNVAAEKMPLHISAETMPRYLRRHIAGGASLRRCTAASSPCRRCRRTSPGASPRRLARVRASTLPSSDAPEYVRLLAGTRAMCPSSNAPTDTSSNTRRVFMLPRHASSSSIVALRHSPRGVAPRRPQYPPFPRRSRERVDTPCCARRRWRCCRRYSTRGAIVSLPRGRSPIFAV